jgi:hypothetical protein
MVKLYEGRPSGRQMIPVEGPTDQRANGFCVQLKRERRKVEEMEGALTEFIDRSPR